MARQQYLETSTLPYLQEWCLKGRFHLSHMNGAVWLKDGVSAILWLYKYFFNARSDILIEHCSSSLKDSKEHAVVSYTSLNSSVANAAMRISLRIRKFFVFHLSHLGP